MNMMKLASAAAVTSLVLSASAFGAPGDMVQTSARTIESVQIQNTPSAAVYYFVAVGGWQASNCPGVIHAYISEDAPGAKAILAAALTAKASGSLVVFTGICGDSAGNTNYLQIRYTTL